MNRPRISDNTDSIPLQPRRLTRRNRRQDFYELDYYGKPRLVARESGAGPSIDKLEADTETKERKNIRRKADRVSCKVSRCSGLGAVDTPNAWRRRLLQGMFMNLAGLAGLEGSDVP